jgi:hypothetical protein
LKAVEHVAAVARRREAKSISRCLQAAHARQDRVKDLAGIALLQHVGDSTLAADSPRGLSAWRVTVKRP